MPWPTAGCTRGWARTTFEQLGRHGGAGDHPKGRKQLSATIPAKGEDRQYAEEAEQRQRVGAVGQRPERRRPRGGCEPTEVLVEPGVEICRPQRPVDEEHHRAEGGCAGSRGRDRCSRESPAHGPKVADSGRGDRISPPGEATILALGRGEALDQLGAQLRRLDHRVDHQLGGQMEDVDVLRVLAALLLDEALALGLDPRSPGSG